MSNLSLDASNPAAMTAEVNNPELDSTAARAQGRGSPDERQQSSSPESRLAGMDMRPNFSQVIAEAVADIQARYTR